MRRRPLTLLGVRSLRFGSEEEPEGVNSKVLFWSQDGEKARMMVAA